MNSETAMPLLNARTRIALADPKAVLDQLCEHLGEHGLRLQRSEDGATIEFDGRRGRLFVGESALLALAEAPDLAGLDAVKQMIAGHVIEFAAPAAPVIAWSGDGSDVAAPTGLRMLTVTDVEDLTPHMRRIRFSGEALARFDDMAALHVRLFLPEPGAEALLPADAGIDAPLPHGEGVAVRKYTIREIDVAAGTLAIDFVVHGDAGPGTAFARRARAGDRIGMAGPGGRGLRPAGWHLFMADETGLPAVARMLEHLPADARGAAIIEVADRGEEQPLRHPPGVSLRWLHRGEAEAGSTTLLQDAFSQLAWPTGDAPLYLWAAAEHAAANALRTAARQVLASRAGEHLIVSYWRQGIA